MSLCALRSEHNLWVIEDAAQGVMVCLEGARPWRTIGHIGCLQLSMKPRTTPQVAKAAQRLSTIRRLWSARKLFARKGTNRSQFFRGQVDKYTWRDIGSSYLMADLQAAYLWAQLGGRRAY
jgi:dTDP-4-amino-4,6-dideoxygalactose transaminase